MKTWYDLEFQMIFRIFDYIKTSVFVFVLLTAIAHRQLVAQIFPNAQNLCTNDTIVEFCGRNRFAFCSTIDDDGSGDGRQERR